MHALIHEHLAKHTHGDFKVFLCNGICMGSMTMSLCMSYFIESTLHDVFIYKAGAFTYFFRT